MTKQESSEASRELEKRIEIIDGLGDEELGSFTHLDWLICIVGSVLIPAILLWRFAG